MTALADGEVIIAKGALAVMTSGATLRASGGVMIQRFWRGDLSPLRQAGADLMTIGAVGLGIVLGVAEADTERRHILRRARVATQLMTSAARRDVAPTRLRARRVTTEAGCVRIEISRDGHRRTAARRTMARHTTDVAHCQVFRVIELHPETHQPRRKWFSRSGLHVGVTNGADRTFRILKLLRVATSAGQVL